MTTEIVDFSAAMADVEASRHRLADAVAAIGRQIERNDASRRRGFSIVRAVQAASTVGVIDGVEREIGAELARQHGQTHDPHRPYMPWSAFTRTLQVGTAAQGGNLVGTSASPAVQALMPYTTVIRLGAEVFDGLRSHVTVPRIGTNASGYWLGELGTATASQPTLGAAALKGKPCGAYSEVSSQLLSQAPVLAERMLSAHLLGLVGGLIDSAAIAGTGSDRPTGIMYTAGVGTQSGTTLGWAGVQAMVKSVGDANAPDPSIAFLGPPAVRELLAKRDVTGGTSGRFVWSGGAVADKPAFASTNVPASTLLCGAFNTVYVLMWGPGVQIEVNPFGQFQANAIGFRVLAHVDIAITQPAAFCVATSIT